MRVLFTNHHLKTYGGSEMSVMELAPEWIRRGHEVAVLTFHAGVVAEELRKLGITVCDRVEDIPFLPQLIHGQHHIPTMLALAAFPEARAIYHCHGYAPWQEKPPIHPRIFRYVGNARQMQKWMQNVTQRNVEDVVILPNAVDTMRFDRVRKARQKLENILIFGNHLALSDKSVEAVRKVCEQRSLALQTVGCRLSGVKSAPETWLADFDVVFAVGRSALEAMASGCAVIPMDAERCGDLITTENFEENRGFNFTAQLKKYPSDAERIGGLLDAYTLEQADGVTHYVREACAFTQYVENMEALHELAVQMAASTSTPSDDEERKAYVGYLTMIANQMDQLGESFMERRDKVLELRSKMQKIKAKLKVQSSKLKTVEKHLRKSWLAKSVWNRVRKEWEHGD